MNRKRESSFLMQGTILAMAAMITKVIGLAYRIPMTNILGETGNGYYGVVFQVYNLALMLTSYSLPMAVSKMVSERVARREYKNVQLVFKSALVFAVIAGGIATAIVFFGAGYIASEILQMDYSVYALRTLAPCILIVAFLGVFRGYFQGHNTMIPTAVSQILEQIVNAVVSIVGAWTLLSAGLEMKRANSADKDLYGAALGAAGGTAGTVAGAFIALVFLVFLYVLYKRIVRQQVRRDRTRHTESTKRIYKVLLLTIVPVILSATLSNITNILDQGLLSNVMAFQGYSEREYTSLLGLLNGQYDTMVGIPFSISTALAASFMPSLITAIQTGTRREIHDKMTMVSRFNMILVIPCAAGFIALSKPILDLLFFTQDNKASAMYLRVGAISVVFFCLSSVTNAALQGLDKMMRPVKNAAIALIVHTVALLIMLVVFRWNAYGVVLSKIVFAGVICLLNARDLKNVCGYVQEIKKTFIIPAIAAAIMGVLSMLVQVLFDLFLPGAVATLLALVAAVAIYGISLVLLGGITEEELKEMPKGTLILSIFKKVRLMR